MTLQEDRMNQDEFLKAVFGEMNVKEKDYTEASRELAEYLYCNYTSFMTAGFDEPHAFLLCVQFLNVLLTKK